jgi:hypothetical protein
MSSSAKLSPRSPSARWCLPSLAGPNLPDQPLLPSIHHALGELRWERGAIITIDGTDYAVNGMAGSRYPPIQRVWSEDSHPEIDIDRLIVQGITLCDW